MWKPVFCISQVCVAWEFPNPLDFCVFTLNNLTLAPYTLWNKPVPSQSLCGVSVHFSLFPQISWFCVLPIGADVLLHTFSPQVNTTPVLLLPKHKQHKTFPCLACFTETKKKELRIIVSLKCQHSVCTLDSINQKCHVLYCMKRDFSLVTAYSSFPFPIQIIAISVAHPALRPIFFLLAAFNPQLLSFSYTEQFTLRTSFCEIQNIIWDTFFNKDLPPKDGSRTIYLLFVLRNCL